MAPGALASEDLASPGDRAPAKFRIELRHQRVLRVGLQVLDLDPRRSSGLLGLEASDDCRLLLEEVVIENAFAS